MKFEYNKQYIDAILIALAVIFPIILIGEPFADDFFRMTGERDFSRDGRYIVNYLLKILSQDSFLFNPYPLAQVSGIIIYALTLTLIIRKIGIIDRLQSGLLLLVTLTTPYMLAVYPYNYDALSICIALSLFSIAPFIFNPNIFSYKSKELYLKSFGKIALLIVAFLFYQPVLPTFVIASLFLFYYAKENKKQILIYNAVMIIVAYLFYTKGILNIYDDAVWYKQQSRINNIFLIPDSIYYGLQSIGSFVIDYYKGFNSTPVLIIIFFALYISFKQSKNKKGLERLICIIGIPSMILINIIAISVINIQPKDLHLRLFISMSSALFYIVLIGLININDNKRYIYNIFMFMIVVPSISMLCIFSYAFKLQKQYEKMMITTLYDGFTFINQHKDEMQKRGIIAKNVIYFMCQNDCLNPYSTKLVQRKAYMQDLLYANTLFNYFVTGLNQYFISYNINNQILTQSQYYIYKRDKEIQENEKIYSSYLYDIYYDVNKHVSNYIIYVKS